MPRGDGGCSIITRVRESEPPAATCIGWKRQQQQLVCYVCSGLTNRKYVPIFPRLQNDCETAPARPHRRNRIIVHYLSHMPSLKVIRSEIKAWTAFIRFSYYSSRRAWAIIDIDLLLMNTRREFEKPILRRARRTIYIEKEEDTFYPCDTRRIDIRWNIYVRICSIRSISFTSKSVYNTIFFQYIFSFYDFSRYICFYCLLLLNLS